MSLLDSFNLKTIRTTVTLRRGQFAEGGNTRVIEGLATEVSIQKPGLPEPNSASIKIYGLKYDAMEQMTMLAFRPLEMYYNTIEISAGRLGENLPTVFKGHISRASADFNQSPDPCMNIEAMSGYFAQQLPTPAITVNGSVSAETIFAQCAKDAEMIYENHGVASAINNGAYPGDPITKMKKLAHDVNCDLIIDDGIVITKPADTPRRGNAVLLSPQTGLIGYPTFSQTGISCKCIFNPVIQYGRLVKIESVVPRATGEWFVTKISHSLSAYTPRGGNWETQIEAARPGLLYGG